MIQKRSNYQNVGHNDLNTNAEVIQIPMGSWDPWNSPKFPSKNNPIAEHPSCMVLYIYLHTVSYRYHKNQPNVGISKYTSPMDPMGSPSLQSSPLGTPLNSHAMLFPKLAMRPTSHVEDLHFCWGRIEWNHETILQEFPY